MKTLKLINPVIKSDVIDDTFTGENTMEVAKSAFKLLAKYMVTTKSNRFIYSLKDVNSNQEYHFDGQKNVVKRGKASLKIKKITIDKTGGGSQKIHLKNMVGSGKKKLDLSSSSNISDDLLKELSVDSSEMSGESTSSDIYGGRSKGKRRRSKRRRKRKSLERAKRKSKRKSRRKSKRRSSSKSDENDSETYEEWLRRRYLFPANTYFFYDPLYYYLPDYTTYIFDRNVFIPNLYYSLYPYSHTVWPWI